MFDRKLVETRLNSWWVSTIMALASLGLWSIFITNCVFWGDLYRKRDKTVNVNQRHVLAMLVVNSLCVIATTGLTAYFLLKIFMDQHISAKLQRGLDAAKDMYRRKFDEAEQLREYANSLQRVGDRSSNIYSGALDGGDVQNYRCLPFSGPVPGGASLARPSDPLAPSRPSAPAPPPPRAGGLLAQTLAAAGGDDGGATATRMNAAALLGQ